MSPARATVGAWVNHPRVPGPLAMTREVWAYRQFVRYLGRRALRKMYARTLFGWWWILIGPLFPILIRALVFGALIGLTSTGVPYFLFLLVGTVSWDLFVAALLWATRGLEMNRGVLREVYVPKVILPVAAMTPALLNLAMNLAVFVAAVAFYLVKDGTTHLSLGLHTVWSLVALVMVVVLAFGIGLFTSMWGEVARDARFTLGQLMPVWMLLTPILYPASAVPEAYRGWLYANPMAAYVEAFKFGLLGSDPPEGGRFAVAVVASLTIAGVGLVCFTRREDTAAETGN